MPNSKYRITESDYEKLIEVAKKVNEATDNVRETKLQKKFMRRSYYPTVECLEAHHVREDFVKYLPYLVYLREPGLAVWYDRTNPEHVRTYKYLVKLFDECLEIVYPGDEAESAKAETEEVMGCG